MPPHSLVISRARRRALGYEVRVYVEAVHETGNVYRDGVELP
jgi:hypothetical protein